MSESLQTVLDRAQATLVGPRALIHVNQRILNQPGLPRIHNASSIINSIKTYNHSELVGDTGAAGLNWQEAAIGSIGECLERYCCAVFDHSQLTYASQTALGDAAVGMERFSLFTRRQLDNPLFPFRPWDAALSQHWVEAEVLGTGEKRFVPACMTFIPYVEHPDPAYTRDQFGLAVSSGQACHSDWNAALISGLCEVVERDAFMITWLKRIAPKRIEWEHDAELMGIFERHFACPNLKFHLFDLTLDIQIPTVACIIEGTSDRGGYLCLGASTRSNYRKAIVKAWLEAAQAQVWMLDLLRSKPDWQPGSDWGNVRDFEDHVRLFAEPWMRSHAEFMLDTPHVVRPDFDAGTYASTADEIDACLRAVQAEGYEVLATDLTTREVRDSGFVVPKVFVPGLAPLYATHGLPTVGSPRFSQVPKKLGRDALPDGQFNPVPHPFP